MNTTFIVVKSSTPLRPFRVRASKTIDKIEEETNGNITDWYQTNSKFQAKRTSDFRIPRHFHKLQHFMHTNNEKNPNDCSIMCYKYHMQLITVNLELKKLRLIFFGFRQY